VSKMFSWPMMLDIQRFNLAKGPNLDNEEYRWEHTVGVR
jgi:hypothetical protein